MWDKWDKDSVIISFDTSRLFVSEWRHVQVAEADGQELISIKDNTQKFFPLLTAKIQ